MSSNELLQEAGNCLLSLLLLEKKQTKQMQVTQKALKDTNFALEELAAEVCNEHLISGEAFWTLVACYAEAKQAQMQGEVV